MFLLPIRQYKVESVYTDFCYKHILRDNLVTKNDGHYRKSLSNNRICALNYDSVPKPPSILAVGLPIRKDKTSLIIPHLSLQ